MKLCKDCKHIHGSMCGYPNKPPYPTDGSTNPNDQMLCFTMRTAMGYCGPEAKWFEPKAPDPGEGWRLMKPHSEIVQANDQCSMDCGKTWIAAPLESCGFEFSPANGLFFRRRIQPELERCPEGHEAELQADRLDKWTEGRVVCVEHCGWSGKRCTTKEEAIAVWNKTMRVCREAEEGK